jgi:hypothetical protein
LKSEVVDATAERKQELQSFRADLQQHMISKA